MKKKIHIIIHAVLLVIIFAMIIITVTFFKSEGVHNFLKFGRIHDGGIGYLYDNETGKYEGEKGWAVDIIGNGYNYKTIGGMWVEGYPVEDDVRPYASFSYEPKYKSFTIFYESSMRFNEIISSITYRYMYTYDKKSKRARIIIFDNEKKGISKVLIIAESKEAADKIWNERR